MRNRSVINGNANKVLLRSLNALSYSCRYLSSTSHTITNDTILVTHHDDRSESKRTASLGYLCYSIDCHETILEFKIIGGCDSITCYCHDALLEFKATSTSGLGQRSEEHTSELQSRQYLVCRLLLEKKTITPTYAFDSLTSARPILPQAHDCTVRRIISAKRLVSADV